MVKQQPALQRTDWTDDLLERWATLEPGFDTASFQVTARISRLALHIGRHEEQVFNRFDLGRGEVGVLSALHIAGPPYRLNPTQLFKSLKLSSAGMTSRLDRLEERGFVRRGPDPNDRRGVLVELTEAGRQVLEQAVRAASATEGKLVTGLDRGEAAQLAALLKKMLASLE